MQIFLVSLVIVLIDQTTKILVKGIHLPYLGISIEGMQLYRSTQVLGDFFRITFIENPGMAFGINFGESSKFYLTLFSLIASIGIIVYLIKKPEEKFIVRFALAMILGGAIGNLIDRMFYGVIYNEAPLFYGKVVDFLDFDFFDISFLGYKLERFPIFNIADSCVTIGVFLLLFFSGSKPKQVSNNQEVKESQEIFSEEYNSKPIQQVKEPGVIANNPPELQ